MPFGYIQWNFASTTSDHPLDDTQLVVLAGLGWSCHTFIFLKVRVLSLSLHFYNSFLDWTLFNFVLLAAVDYRCCIIKSKVDVGTTNTLAHTALALTSTPCIHDGSGLRDAVEEIAADRLPLFKRKDTDGIWRSCSVSLLLFFFTRSGVFLFYLGFWVFLNLVKF